MKHVFLLILLIPVIAYSQPGKTAKAVRADSAFFDFARITAGPVVVGADTLATQAYARTHGGGSPGTGTIEAVTTTFPLTGGNTSGTATIGMDTTAAYKYMKYLLSLKAPLAVYLVPSDTAWFHTILESMQASFSSFSIELSEKVVRADTATWLPSWADILARHYLVPGDSTIIKNGIANAYAPKVSPTFTGNVDMRGASTLRLFTGTGTLRSASDGYVSVTASDTVGHAASLASKMDSTRVNALRGIDSARAIVREAQAAHDSVAARWSTMLSQHYLTPGDSTTIKNSMAALYGSRLAWSDTSAMFAFMKQQLALKMFATAFADSHNVHSYGVGGSTSGGIVVSAGTDSMYISTITLASILSRLSALEGASPASISKDSLYAYYTFESNGRDTSGRGNHLTGINAPTFNTGKVGNAAYFDSTQAWYNETMVVDSATSFTVGGWVYYSPGGNYGTMFSSYNSKGWTTYNNTSAALGGPISLYSVPASGSGVVAASDSVTAARWMFVVVSYSATSDSMWLQVNNAEKVGAVATIPTAGISGVGEFTVGAHPDGTLPSIIRQMKGKVDELFVYHRVLAAAELTWYFNSGAGRTWAEAKAAMGL